MLCFFVTYLPLDASAEKAGKDLARKMAVATHYQSILEQKYGMALVSIKGTKDEILFISMIRVTDDRINAILNAGLYKDARKARFKKIIFADINQQETVISVK
jgi:hypothetical protein